MGFFFCLVIYGLFMIGMKSFLVGLARGNARSVGVYDRLAKGYARSGGVYDWLAKGYARSGGVYDWLAKGYARSGRRL